MRHLRILLVLAALCASAVAFAQADPPGRVGRLADTQGTVWFYSRDNGEWVEAQRNRPVTNGDRIATDASARAELSIGSSTVRLGSGSELEVQRLDDAAVRLQLHDGSLALRVRSPAAASEFELVTDEGRFLPLGPGSYRLDRADATSTATAWRGSLRYEGDGQALALDDGQRADFWLDGATARYNLVAPERDAFADWVASRDREDDAVVVAPYVSPEMTGADDLNRYGSWQRSPDYGALWVPATVAPDWAPYRFGHWGFVQPWGWTWIDDAPWGFAPFHYGRWVQFGGRWCWSPGAYVARPVYAPALVAWLGGPRLSVSVNIGTQPSVGWFPLGPREVFVPGYRVSPRYVRNVNITQVTNITNVTNIVANPNAAVNRTSYVNRSRAVTIVPTSVLAHRQPVAPVAIKAADELAPRGARRPPVLAAAPVTPAPLPQAGRAPGVSPPGLVTRGRGPRERPVAQALEPDAPAATRAAPPPALPKIRVPRTATPAEAGGRVEPRDARRGDVPAPPRAAAVPGRTVPVPRPNHGERVITPRAAPPAVPPQVAPREGQERRIEPREPTAPTIPRPRPVAPPVANVPAPHAPVAPPRVVAPAHVTPPAQVTAPAHPVARPRVSPATPEARQPTRIAPRQAGEGPRERGEGPRDRGDGPRERGGPVNRMRE